MILNEKKGGNCSLGRRRSRREAKRFWRNLKSIAMAFNNGLRSASRLLSQQPIISKSVNRGFHSTGVKQMGGHGHDEPFYLHAKHMYNLDRMSHQKLKMSLAVFSAVGIGIAVPIIAVVFQQNKTASG